MLDYSDPFVSLCGFGKFRRAREKYNQSLEHSGTNLAQYYGELIRRTNKFSGAGGEVVGGPTLAESKGGGAKTIEKGSSAWAESLVQPHASLTERRFGKLKEGGRQSDTTVRRFVKQTIGDDVIFIRPEDFVFGKDDGGGLIGNFASFTSVSAFLRRVIRVNDSVHSFVGSIQPLLVGGKRSEDVSDDEVRKRDLDRNIFFNSSGMGSCAKFVHGAGKAFAIQPGPNVPPYCSKVFVFVGPVTPINAAFTTMEGVCVPIAIGVNVVFAVVDPSSEQGVDRSTKYSVGLQMILTPMSHAAIAVNWGKPPRSLSHSKEHDCVSVDVPLVMTGPEFFQNGGRDNISASESDEMSEDGGGGGSGDDQGGGQGGLLFGAGRQWTVDVNENKLRMGRCLRTNVFNGLGPSFDTMDRQRLQTLDYHAKLIAYKGEGAMSDGTTFNPLFDTTVKDKMNIIFETMPLLHMMNLIETYEPNPDLISYPLQFTPVNYGNNAIWPIQYAVPQMGQFLRSQIAGMYHIHALKLVVVGLTLDCMRLVGLFGDQASIGGIDHDDMDKFMLAVFADASMVDDGGGMLDQRGFDRSCGKSAYRTAFFVYIKKIMYMWHQRLGTFPFGSSRQRESTLRELHKTRYGLEILIDSLVIRRWNLQCESYKSLTTRNGSGSTTFHNRTGYFNLQGHADNDLVSNIVDPKGHGPPKYDTGIKLSEALEREIYKTLDRDATLQSTIDKAIVNMRPVSNPSRGFSFQDMLRMDSSGDVQCALLQFPVDIEPLHIFVDIGTQINKWIHGWDNIHWTFLNAQRAFGIPENVVDAYTIPVGTRVGKALVSESIRKHESGLRDSGSVDCCSQAASQARFYYRENVSPEVERITALDGRNPRGGFKTSDDVCGKYKIDAIGVADDGLVLQYKYSTYGFPATKAHRPGEGLVDIRLEMKHKFITAHVAVPGLQLTNGVKLAPDPSQIYFNAQLQQGAQRLRELSRYNNGSGSLMPGPGWGGLPHALPDVEKQRDIDRQPLFSRFNELYLERHLMLFKSRQRYDTKVLEEMYRLHSNTMPDESLNPGRVTEQDPNITSTMKQSLEEAYDAVKLFCSHKTANGVWLSVFDSISAPRSHTTLTGVVRYAGVGDGPIWTDTTMVHTDFGESYWVDEMSYTIGKIVDDNDERGAYLKGHFGFSGFCKDKTNPDRPRTTIAVTRGDIDHLYGISEWRLIGHSDTNLSKQKSVTSGLELGLRHDQFWINYGNVETVPPSHGRIVRNSGPPYRPSVNCNFGGFLYMPFPPRPSLGIFWNKHEVWSCYYRVITGGAYESTSFSLEDLGFNQGIELGPTSSYPSFFSTGSKFDNLTHNLDMMPFRVVRVQQQPTLGRLDWIDCIQNLTFTSNNPMNTGLMDFIDMVFRCDGLIHMSLHGIDARRNVTWSGGFRPYLDAYLTLVFSKSTISKGYIKIVTEYVASSRLGSNENKTIQKKLGSYIANLHMLIVKLIIENLYGADMLAYKKRFIAMNLYAIIKETKESAMQLGFNGMDVADAEVLNLSTTGSSSNESIEAYGLKLLDHHFTQATNPILKNHDVWAWMCRDNIELACETWRRQLFRSDALFEFSDHLLVNSNGYKYFNKQIALFRLYAGLNQVGTGSNDARGFKITPAVKMYHIVLHVLLYMRKRLRSESHRTKNQNLWLQAFDRCVRQIQVSGEGKNLEELGYDSAEPDLAIIQSLPI
jgi:hypothetical protein